MSKFTLEQAAMVRRAYFNAKRAAPDEDMLFALNTVLDSAPEPQSLALRQEVALRLLVAGESSDPAEYWVHGDLMPSAIAQAFFWADAFLAHKDRA
jgi:hypothetical protein